MTTEYYIDRIPLLDIIPFGNGVVLGDEGCYKCAFSKNNLCILSSAIHKDIPVRYVTPVLGQSHVEKARKILINITESTVLKTVFNDLGLMYALKDYICEGRIIPVLGRVLTKSLIDCPWYGDIIGNESLITKRAIVGSTFYHESKIDFFKNFGVCEIEMNYCEDRYLSELKRCGWKITVYQSDRLISVGRSCYWALWHDGDIDKCDGLPQCNENIYIELEKKWSSKNKMLTIPDLSDKKRYDSIYVRGNKVYQKNSKILSSKYIDCLIKSI